MLSPKDIQSYIYVYTCNNTNSYKVCLFKLALSMEYEAISMRNGLTVDIFVICL